MEGIDPQIAFAVKEEILKNVLKTHAIIFLEGWTGTGKTVTALKASRELGPVCYINGAGPAKRIPIERYNDAATVLPTLKDVNNLTAPPAVLIIDEVSALSAAAQEELKGLLLKKGVDRKILLITRVALDMKELLASVDAVVRFKKSTAELLLTHVHDLGINESREKATGQ